MRRSESNACTKQPRRTESPPLLIALPDGRATRRQWRPPSAHVCAGFARSSGCRRCARVQLDHAVLVLVCDVLGPAVVTVARERQPEALVETLESRRCHGSAGRAGSVAASSAVLGGPGALVVRRRARHRRAPPAAVTEISHGKERTRAFVPGIGPVAAHVTVTKVRRAPQVASRA